MRLVFAGTPEAAVPSLRILAQSAHEVVAVITRPDAVAGRGRKSVTSEVGVVANELGIPLLKPESVKTDVFHDQLQELAPDVCPVVAYGALLPQSILDIPRFGWVNLHFSLLPAWRGAAPVQHSILAGDDITGATTFRLTAGMDTGPTFGVVTEAIKVGDTSSDLLDRLSQSGARLLLETLNGIEQGTIGLTEQSSEGVSMAPKITVEDARVRWTEPAVSIDRRVRAVTSSPGAWTMLAGERIKIGSVQLVGNRVEVNLAPGELAVTKKDVLVGSATEPLSLTSVQPPGKKMMAAADWARGARIETGLRFE